MIIFYAKTTITQNL